MSAKKVLLRNLNWAFASVYSLVFLLKVLQKIIPVDILKQS